jgi:hypothetical protein
MHIQILVECKLSIIFLNFAYLIYISIYARHICDWRHFLLSFLHVYSIDQYLNMHVRSGTTVVSLIRANWRDYSWRQLDLSPDFQSLPTQNIYRETGWERLEERRTRRKLQFRNWHWDWTADCLFNLDDVSRLRTERLRLFHSLTVAGTKESLVKECLQNGTIISLPFRRG